MDPMIARFRIVTLPTRSGEKSLGYFVVLVVMGSPFIEEQSALRGAG